MKLMLKHIIWGDGVDGVPGAGEPEQAAGDTLLGPDG